MHAHCNTGTQQTTIQAERRRKDSSRYMHRDRGCRTHQVCSSATGIGLWNYALPTRLKSSCRCPLARVHPASTRMYITTDGPHHQHCQQLTLPPAHLLDLALPVCPRPSDCPPTPRYSSELHPSKDTHAHHGRWPPPPALPAAPRDACLFSLSAMVGVHS